MKSVINNNRFRNITMSIVCMLAALPALAVEGHGGGNGGADYVLNGKDYLLDLVEAGVQDDPYFASKVLDPEIEKLVNEKIGEIASPKVVDLVTAKLTEIHSRYPFLGEVMKYTVFTTQIFAPAPGLRHPYLEKSPLIYDAKKLKRVAVRQDQTIYLDRKIFDKFSESNQSALFIHEWTSAIIREFKDSVDTRKIVGTFFSKNGSDYEIKRLFTAHGLAPLVHGGMIWLYKAQSVVRAQEPRFVIGSNLRIVGTEVWEAVHYDSRGPYVLDAHAEFNYGVINLPKAGDYNPGVEKACDHLKGLGFFETDPSTTIRIIPSFDGYTYSLKRGLSMEAQALGSGIKIDVGSHAGCESSLMEALIPARRMLLKRIQ